MNGMGAFCICCGTKVSTGIRTAEDLASAYPTGCYCCATAKSDTTRATLAKMIKEAGYAFVDMEGNPLIVGKKK